MKIFCVQPIGMYARKETGNSDMWWTTLMDPAWNNPEIQPTGREIETDINCSPTLSNLSQLEICLHLKRVHTTNAYVLNYFPSTGLISALPSWWRNMDFPLCQTERGLSMHPPKPSTFVQQISKFITSLFRNQISMFDCWSLVIDIGQTFYCRCSW